MTQPPNFQCDSQQIILVKIWTLIKIKQNLVHPNYVEHLMDSKHEVNSE